MTNWIPPSSERPPYFPPHRWQKKLTLSCYWERFASAVHPNWSWDVYQTLPHVLSWNVKAIWLLHSHFCTPNTKCGPDALCHRLCFSRSIHGSWGEEKKKNNGDGAGLHVGFGDGCPAQGDGRCHAGTGGRSAPEADGPREGNAEQSDRPASSDAWADQRRKPPETPWTAGQDTLEGSFGSLKGSACVPWLREHFPAQLTRAYTSNFILKSFAQQCCSSFPLFDRP